MGHLHEAGWPSLHRHTTHTMSSSTLNIMPLRSKILSRNTLKSSTTLRSKTLRSSTLRSSTLRSITPKSSTQSNSSNTLRRAEGDGARVLQVAVEPPAEVPRALSVVLFYEGLLLATDSEVCSEAAVQRSSVRCQHTEEQGRSNGTF